MAERWETDDETRRLAEAWCSEQSPAWTLGPQLGKGGTAPVYEVVGPSGTWALKIYDEKFSTGERGEKERKRLAEQLKLRGHQCPYLVQVIDGGEFANRLFVLMSRAVGTELEKCLHRVPPDRIREIVDQIARAVLFLRENSLCHRDIKAANIFISDNFKQATLLDISVIRNVEDPVGAGTDQGDALPVLATARYSPPEYLFRLEKPTPQFWNALNIYQLGALLHDLIMKRPLFEEEYRRSEANRYRFAWVIATVMPLVQSADVASDLVALANRALDKNWTRRSSLRVEDFLTDAETQKRRGLSKIGVGQVGPAASGVNLALVNLRTMEVATELDAKFRAYLGALGIQPYHEIKASKLHSGQTISLWWTVDSGPLTETTEVSFTLEVELKTQAESLRISIVAELATREADSKSAQIELPEFADSDGIDILLLQQVQSAFEQLAANIASE